MCRFKSGIILKNRVVLSRTDNESHSDLLDEVNIEDTKENAMTKFVRAELVPPNNEWWTDTDAWKINIDQDIAPSWFEEDKEKYITEFKQAVKDWCNEHVLVDKKIDELSKGYYRLKRCEVKRLLKDVIVMCDNSTVSMMCGNSTVNRMYDNSTVNEMCGNSTVNRMYDNSTVNEMCGNSIARDIKNKKILMAGNFEIERRGNVNE